ncbi:MAG: tetratricopeptide repeat protein [Draconibacterium sp.]|nr:tetratricopeptide repeat protein [Draconibacterium sp.]
MKEDKGNYRDDEIIGAVNRFKHSLISGNTKYFDVEEFEEIVEQLLEEGDLQGSEIAAEQGIQIHPNAIPLHLKYAQVLINTGKYEKSLEYLLFAEKVDSNNPDVHLLKGSARMVMGDEPEALLSFKKAIKYAGKEIDEVLYNISASYIQVGAFSKAIYYLEQTVRANPKNEMALNDLGFFYDQSGMYKKSIKYYNKYIDIDPFNDAVWFNLGTVFNKINKHKKAIEAYEFALALNDNFNMALFNIGNALANAEKYEEAIEKYKEFLEVDPENSDAYCYIGECFLNLENHVKSEVYYKKALTANKKNDTAWFGIGLTLWINKSYAKSIIHIKKAIKIDNQNSEYWLILGRVNSDAGNIKIALKAFKQAAKFDAGNTEIWLTWTDLFVANNDIKSAIRIIKKGIKNNTDSILKYRLIALLLEVKKEKDAFELLIIAMKQEFEHINFLFDIYPKSLKNKRLKKVVDNFRKENKIE